MSNYISKNLEESDKIVSLSSKIKAEKFWLDIIFEFYRRIYQEKKNQSISLSRQKIFFLVEALIWSLYMATFLWIPNLNISDWKDNNSIWKIIGYVRLDNLCSAFEVQNLCVYLSLSFIMLNIIGIFIILILIYFSKWVPGIIFYFFQVDLTILYKFLSLPLFTLLLICLKYNWFPSDDVWEYDGNNKAASFQANNYTQFFIILGLICLFILNLSDTIWSGKINHSFANIRLDSRAHSKIDIYSALLIFFVPLVFIVAGNERHIFFQITLMIISGTLAMLTISEMPYFGFFMNCLVSIKFLEVSLLSALFIFAKIIDTSIVIWLFMFTIMPCITVLIIRKLKISSQKFDLKFPKDPQNIANAYELEHSLRHYLCLNNIENKSQILLFLGKCANETTLFHNKLLVVWETNYCLFTLNDHALARIKLWKAKYSDHSLEGDFQEYICIKNISESNGHESVEFLDYFRKINEIKTEDAILCIKLLDFWKEIVSPNINSKKVNNQMEYISGSIKTLSENYSNLHQKFPKSKEALSYYLTYAKNIIYDFDKSNLLSSKLQTIDDLANQNVESKNISFFDEKNGILLISFEENNFGNIAYANKRASEILKFSINEATGCNFSSFLPPPYDSFFNRNLLKLLQFATEVEIKIPSHFFLLLPSKFIIDCIGKASVVSLSNRIYILMIFQEIKHFYGFALLSKYHEIFCQSENFSKFIEKTPHNFEGFNLNHLFPSLKNIDLQPFKPYKVIGTETYLISRFIELYGLSIDYVLLTEDLSEINVVNSKNNKTENNKNFIEDSSKSKLTFDLVNKDLQSKYLKNFKTESQSRFSQSSETSSHFENLNKIVNLSLHSIKIFHIVFILSMLTVMTLNSIVLIYTSNAIVGESDIDLLILLGKIEKSVQEIAHNARGVNVLEGGPQDLIDFSYNQIISYMRVLEETHQNITSNLIDWSMCGGNDAFTNENIPIWNNIDGFYIKQTNLIDAISQFIGIGYVFLDKYNNKQDNTREVQFINLNGLSQIFNYCNRTLYTFTDCVMNNSKELESWMDILLVIGFANLMACLGITMIFAKYSINAENNLWNKIKKNACKNYENLKATLFDRLSEMHGKRNILFSDSKKMSEKGNFKNHWKYFWRNSVYFVLAMTFFLVNYLYLYQNCVDYLYLRPSLLRAIINSQVLYKSLIVWTSEFSISETPISLKSDLSEVYPFSYELSCMNNAVSSLLNSEKEIRNSKYSSLLSKESMDVFFENTNNITKIADYGVYAAGRLLPFEAYYLDFAGIPDYLVMWFNLVEEINALDSEYDLLVDLADKDSQRVIMQQLNWITATLIDFIILSWLLYFVFYLPFLLKEQKKLENMKTIAKLIPTKYFK